MKTQIRLGLGLVMLTLVLTTACAQMGQLINYTISEDELERLTISELAKHRFEVDVMGASARLTVDELGLTIGDDGDGLVHVRTQSSIVASVLGREYPVSVRLNVAGAPRYSAADHAIYVTGLTLQDSSIDSSFGQLRVNGIHQELYTLIDNWLAENPIYRFDPEDSRYRLLQQLGLSISVEPGQLRIQSETSQPN